MLRAAWIALAVCAALAGGCVVAYDPAAPARFGVGEQAPVRLVAPPRSRQVEAPVRPAPAPAPVVAAAPREIPAVAPPPPESPSGRQLAWLMEVLSGGELRKLETHLSPQLRARTSPVEVRRTILKWRRDVLEGGGVELKWLAEAPDGSLVALLRGKASDRYTEVHLAVDGQGRISSLLLAPVVPPELRAPTTWEGIDTALAALSGSVSMAVVEISDARREDAAAVREVHSFGAGRRLAIAGSSRLYLLIALAEVIGSGKVSWTEVVTIQDSLKSLPPGRLQLLTEGMEVKLVEAVEALTGLGDNTAFDHLLARVGRLRVEDTVRRLNADTMRNLPFLSTMEVFRLKLTADRELARRYAAAGEQERRNMLAPGGLVEQATIGPEALALWKVPYLVDQIGWFATSAECCAAMAELCRLERGAGLEPLGRALRLGPVPTVDRRVWRSVASSTGSAPGVLNLTWLLERADGRWFVFSLGWNDAVRTLDVPRADEVAGAALRILAGEK